MGDELITQNKGKGRPKKSPAPVLNEEQEVITMSSNKVPKHVVEGMVGKVKSTPTISLDDVQARWRNVFSKFGAAGYDNIVSAWNKNATGLNNPFMQNARIKEILTPDRKVKKDEIKEILQDPTHNEALLRGISMNLYYANYIYQTLVQLNRHTPKYNFYANPLYLEEDYNKNKLREDSIKVDKILKKFDPKLTFKTINTQVYAEGKSSYLVRTSYNKKDVDFLVMQKLNSDMVKITGFGSKQQFIVSFNMMIFLKPAYDVSQYPQYIRDVWQEMQDNGIIIEDKKGKKKWNPKASIPNGHIIESRENGQFMYWVRLPQDLCYTFYSDGSHPNVFPDTIGLFEDFTSLDDYRWLQGNLLSRGVTSVLTAEVPLIKDLKSGADQTALSVDTILGFTDLFNQNVSANVLPFFAPFNDYKLHSVDTQPEAMDIIYDRVRDIIASSGQAPLLSVSEKPSIATTKAAEAIQASKNDYLTRQFEDFLNHVINENFNLNYDWAIKLHGDIFFDADNERITKELVLSGVKGLLGKLLSYEGLTLEDYKGTVLYMDALDIEIISRNYEEKNPVGRPKINDDDVVNDSTAASKASGTNVSEIKEFGKVCPRCGKQLENEEQYLCSSCIEELAEEI